MGKLKRFESFEDLKADTVKVLSKDLVKIELELQHLFINLRNHKVIKKAANNNLKHNAR
jgi:hypothetical protein